MFLVKYLKIASMLEELNMEDTQLSQEAVVDILSVPSQRGISINLSGIIAGFMQLIQ